MKTLFVLIILLSLFLGNFVSSKRALNFKHAKKNMVIGHKTDTLVGLHKIPKEFNPADYVEREYFLIYDNDTSSFSCILSENVINKNLSMEIEYSPYQKMPVLHSLTDTNAVSEQIIKKTYKELSYEEQLKEFRFILNFISKDYSISRVKKIGMLMSAFKEFPQRITRKYLDQFGEKFSYKSNEKIKKLIEESELGPDINKILSPYSIVIDKIFVQEFLYYVPETDEMEGDVARRRSAKKQKRIIDGDILFNLKATTTN